MQAAPSGCDVPFFLADRATIQYGAIFHPDHSVEEVKREIADRLATAARLDPWLREHPPQIEWHLEWSPWQVSTDGPICVAMQRAAEGTRFEGPAVLAGFSGVCDVSWFDQAGIPGIVYGPGDLRVAHQEDEAVRIDEVLGACRAFALLALDWCGT
jgi:acetylornithine deacetylase/succinyl-diaminopimelate desuccinylase-like protein